MNSELVDRDPQNLLVPLGGMDPVRVRQRRRLRIPRFDPYGLRIGVAAVCGVVGIGLLLAPSPTAVTLVGDQLRVGGMVLNAIGPTGDARLLRYQGGASYALAQRQDGTTRAAAVWAPGGKPSSGVCVVHRDGARLVDECVFESSAGQRSAVDVLDPVRGPLWQRTYDDGVHVTIPVSADGGAVPVAFPIGH